MSNTASTLPEILQCLNTATGYATAASPSIKGGADRTLLERQTAVMKCQQHQLHLQLQHHQQPQEQQCYFNEFSIMSVPAQTQSSQALVTIDGLSGLTDLILNRRLKLDPRLMQTAWPDFGSTSGLTSIGLHSSGAYATASAVNCLTSTLTQTPPEAVNEAMLLVTPRVNGGDCISTQKLSALAGASGRESFKKRKPEKSLPPKEDSRTKKVKACGEEDQGRSTDQQQNCIRNSAASNTNNTNPSNGNSNNHNNDSKNNNEASGCTSKAGEVQKADYIHVRARRGQATDSHSLAERVRREKISERMKYLQDLVPGCNKITGKAGMLDEIINYVQSLQRQVEFLSMKLAAVNPRIDSNIEDLFAKEVIPACSAVQLPTMGVSPDILNQSNLQYNAVQTPMGTLCGSDINVNPVVNINLRPSISTPMSVPVALPDLSGFNHIHSASPWEAELQNIFPMEFQQARPNSFQPHTYTGSANEGASTTLKMEM